MYVRTHRAGSDPRVAARASGKHPRSLDRWFNQEKFATGERAADADRRPLRSFSLSLSLVQISHCFTRFPCPGPEAQDGGRGDGNEDDHLVPGAGVPLPAALVAPRSLSLLLGFSLSLSLSLRGELHSSTNSEEAATSENGGGSGGGDDDDQTTSAG